MNRTIAKEIILIGVFFCLGVLGTRLYGQVDQVDDINLTGFPTDETLLRGESRKMEKTSLKINVGKALPKSLKEASVKRKIAEKEPMGNLHQMQKMSQYPGMDITGQMKRLRALQWTGRGLWMAGTCLIAVGSWCIDDGSWWGDEGEIAGGVISLLCGIASAGVGVTMDIINTQRIKELKRSMVPTASLDFGTQKYGVGFGLHF